MQGRAAELAGNPPPEPGTPDGEETRSVQTPVLAAIVVIAVSAMTVWSIMRTTPIDSDDAARPVLVDSIFRVGFADGAVIPEDSYFTRVPIFLASQLVAGGLGRSAIGLGYVMTAVAVAAAAIVLHRVVVGRVVIVPAVAAAVALIAITPLNLSIVRSSHRGLEVLTTMAAAIWLVQRLDHASSRGRAASAAIVIAICVSAEPYAMWLVAFPLAGLTLLVAVWRRSVRAAEPAAWILGGVIGAQLLNGLLVALGADIHRFDNPISPSNALSASKWELALRAVRRALLGGDELRITDVLPIAVAALVVAVWCLVGVVCWRARRPGAVAVFALLYPVLVLLAYVVTPNIDVPGSYRYVGPLMLALPLSVAVVIASGEQALARAATRMALASAVIAVVNVPVFAAQSPKPEFDVEYEAALHEMLDVVETNGLDHGYAEYWNSHRSTVLSGGEVTVLPVVCGPDGLARYDWVTNRAAADRDGPAFLLIDPVIEACTGDFATGEHLWSDPELGLTLVLLDGPLTGPWFSPG
jgi:hypothetical protein